MIGSVDSFVTDSVPDKIGRETSVFVAGISQGLYTAAANVSEHPFETAAEVASGVAIGALTARVAILKVPVLALSAYGAVSTIKTGAEFIDKASPAVADVWRSADVSAETKNQLKYNISDFAAAATVGVGSILLANKGFKLLERDAPNNALGRFVFDQEPVSFKYPRHFEHRVNSKINDIELMPFKPRELAKLINVESRDVTYRDFAPGPFKDYREGLITGRLNTVERSRVYTINGASTEVVVPEWYDKKLDRVRQLEKSLTFPHSFLNAGRNNSIRLELANHPLSGHAKPEDILTNMAQLPDPSFLKQIVLSPYPLARFEVHTVRPGVVGAAAAPSNPIGLAVGRDRIAYLLSSALRPVGSKGDPGEVIRHEWAHFAENASPPYRQNFDRAAYFERVGFYTRHYATTNNRENQAVHMAEGLLANRNSGLQKMAVPAPLRTAVIGRRLRDILDNVPVEGRGLYHAHYMDRVDRMDKSVLPRALRSLGYAPHTAPEVQKRAANLASYLKRESLPPAEPILPADGTT